MSATMDVHERDDEYIYESCEKITAVESNRASWISHELFLSMMFLCMKFYESIPTFN